jgi:hypothetical protein
MKGFKKGHRSVQTATENLENIKKMRLARDCFLNIAGNG